MSINLGSLAISAGVNTKFSEAPGEGVKAIVIGNESGLTCTITMQGGNVQKTLYPGVIDWFAVKPGFTGVILINPVALLSNISSWPSSSLVFDAIGANDPEQASMYPLALSRNTNVGNNVNTVGGTSSAIQNDNNPAGTSILESTPSGQGASALSLTNDGIALLKILIGGVYHQWLKTQTAGNPLQIGQAGDIVEVLGKLLIDQIATAGPTSPPAGTGTVTIYEFTIGVFKLVVVDQAALKNTSASTFTMTLPTAFASKCLIVCGDHGGMELQHAGASINLDILTGLAQGANSAVTSGVRLFSGNVAYSPVNSSGVDAPFETLLFEPGNASAHTGMIFIVGI